MRKENKNNGFIQQFFSFSFCLLWRANIMMHALASASCKQRMHMALLLTLTRTCIVYMKQKQVHAPVILSKMPAVLLDFIKIISIWVPKMNEGLTSLERHEGE